MTVERLPWFPFLIYHGRTRIGIYWGCTERNAKAFARMEARSFGPVVLDGQRLKATRVDQVPTTENKVSQ